MSTKYKYISLEGGEGVGKTTALIKLKKELESRGEKVCVIREPGSDEFGDKIRNIIMSSPDLDQDIQANLFALAMKETMINIIRPALQDGCVILSDRSPVSSLVYQAQVFGLSINRLREIFFYNNLVVPDMTFWLKANPEFGLMRIAKNNREQNFFDKKTLDFHNKVYDGYQYLVDNEIVPIREIDAKTEHVAEDILKELF